MEKSEKIIKENAMRRQLVNSLRLLLEDKEFLLKSEIELIKLLCAMYEFTLD